MSPRSYASIVVPTRNEERHIGACLDAVLAQDYPHDRFEVLVVDGRSTDRTRRIVEQAAERDGRVRLLDNPARTTPAALNAALREARGDYLVRVDAHSVPEPHYLRTLVDANVALDAALVGAWVDAAGEGAFARAVAAAFRSAFSMGSPAAWNRPSRPREVASAPCGSYDVAALRAIGGFDEGQLANQDYEANHRLRAAGGRIFIVPDVSFRYFPRDTIGALAHQFARYGFYKARTMAKHPDSIRPRHLVPAASLVLLAVAAATAFVWAPAAWAVAVAAAAYAVALAVASMLAGRTLGRAAFLLPAVFATMHASWAVGNLAGLVRFWPGRRALR